MNVMLTSLIDLFKKIPDDLIALLARFTLASTFWASGQTKIMGFAFSVFPNFELMLGWPSMNDLTFILFEHEYALPLIPADMAAYLATFAEHLFPILLVLGLATRFSAFALLIMTAVIQIFVYPSAYALHGTWAVAMLFLMAKGPGRLSLDAVICRKA